MILDRKALVDLLPAIYRLRDREEGEPLARLLSVMAEQIEVLQENVEQLYDDQFIETCAEWVVPYIGELVGTRGVRDVRAAGFSTRAYVANTIAYRRRKGTASMLEQLARDLSGWNAAVVEFFLRLAWTQFMNHIRPDAPVWIDLRDPEALEQIGTPFERAMRTVDVRRIGSGRGRFNIPNVGIFLWRIEAYPLTSSPAVPVDALRWMFSPLGNDAPLYSFARPEDEVAHLAERDNVPMPVTRRALARDVTRWYGDPGSILVRLGGVPVAAANVVSCNLADIGPSWDHTPAPVDKLAIDPALGRMSLPADADIVTVWFGAVRRVAALDPADPRRFTWAPPDTNPTAVKVRGVPVDPSQLRLADTTDLWDPVLPENDVVLVDTAQRRLIFPADPGIPLLTSHYGAVADIGGGEYEREASFAGPGRFVVQVPERPGTPPHVTQRPTIFAALQLLKSLGTSGVIEIDGSGRYEENIAFDLAPGQRIELRAKNGARPTLILLADAAVLGGADSELSLNGLLMAGGGLAVPGASDLAALRIRHCTLVPGRRLLRDGTPVQPPAPSLTVHAAKSLLSVEIENSIAGAIHMLATAGTLAIRNSVVDCTAPNVHAIGSPASGAGPMSTIERSTIFGTVSVRELTLGSESIFTGTVTAERKQSGCVRFSFVPRGSSTPRRYHSQPELAVREALEARSRAVSPASLTVAEIDAVTASAEAAVVPYFVSRHYGHAAYAQLADSVHRAITTGSENGSEMGVYCDAEAARREANVRAALDEYLRFGLEAGIFYVS